MRRGEQCGSRNTIPPPSPPQTPTFALLLVLDANIDCLVRWIWSQPKPSSPRLFLLPSGTPHLTGLLVFSSLLPMWPPRKLPPLQRPPPPPPLPLPPLLLPLPQLPRLLRPLLPPRLLALASSPPTRPRFGLSPLSTACRPLKTRGRERHDGASAHKQCPGLKRMKSCSSPV